MITLLNYEKNENGKYVCHFSVGSTEMSYEDALEELQKVCAVDFAVSPKTMGTSLDLGVPTLGSTVTMYYNGGVVVYYRASEMGEYTDFVIDGNYVLGPVDVDVRWKTIFENNNMIGPLTEAGEVYEAMFACPAPSIADVIEVTENGYYGWPTDKDPSEWTDEEWERGPIKGVKVNVTSEPPTPPTPPTPVEHVVKTVIGTPTQVQTTEGGPSETYYCVEYDELKGLIDSADELIFKLSDSEYTRPLMGFGSSSNLTHFEIIELLGRTYDGNERTVGTKSICVVKNGSLMLANEERNYIHNNINSKIPYNIYNSLT